jgi:hypothetical protein
MTSRCDAFKKGMTSKTPSSHVQEGQGFHPLRKTREGEEARRPQLGKMAPTGVAVVKAFVQRYPLQTKHQASMILLPATTIVENASPHDHASRGATTRQLHMAAAQLRQQAPPLNEQRTAPLTQSHRRHPPPNTILATQLAGASKDAVSRHEACPQEA